MRARRGLVEDGARHLGEVDRAGVVAGVLEAVGRAEARARQPEVAGALVHPLHEGGDGAAHALGQRDGGVVARGQQQPVEHRLELDALALGQHADGRALVGERLLGHADLGVGRRALDHDQRGHHLGQAGDRQHPVGLAAPQDLAGVEVEEQAAARRALEASPARGRTRRASASASGRAPGSAACAGPLETCSGAGDDLGAPRRAWPGWPAPPPPQPASASSAIRTPARLIGQEDAAGRRRCRIRTGRGRAPRAP